MRRYTRPEDESRGVRIVVDDNGTASMQVRRYDARQNDVWVTMLSAAAPTDVQALRALYGEFKALRSMLIAAGRTAAQLEREGGR